MSSERRLCRNPNYVKSFIFVLHELRFLRLHCISTDKAATNKVAVLSSYCHHGASCSGAPSCSTVS
ncbi:unnamed protein product, partial [Musa textilis]